MAFLAKNNNRETMDSSLWIGISNLKVVSDKFVTFNLIVCKGVSLYNMRAISSNGKEFITAGQHKSGDRYYNSYGAYMADDDQKALFGVIKDMIAQGETERMFLG